MGSNSVADNGLVDYEVGNIQIDYAEGSFSMEMKSPWNVPETLEIYGFEEINVEKREPWGAGKYVASSELRHQEGKELLEIKLNSGDTIIVTRKSDV